MSLSRSMYNIFKLAFLLHFQQGGNDILSQQLRNTVLSVTKLAGVSFILPSLSHPTFKRNYFLREDGQDGSQIHPRNLTSVNVNLKCHL